MICGEVIHIMMVSEGGMYTKNGRALGNTDEHGDPPVQIKGYLKLAALLDTVVKAAFGILPFIT